MWTLLQLLGAAMVVVGTAMLSPWAALVVAGAMVAGVAFLLEPPKARS